MVTRVGKFLGGLGADVTSVANVHASQNRIALGGDENPSANAHVIGTLLATTNTIVGATAEHRDIHWMLEVLLILEQLPLQQLLYQLMVACRFLMMVISDLQERLMLCKLVQVVL